ncbi:hypothetical protein ACH5RR_023839 [Cinchona calisaya]|uniref:PRA1 family protein n=1 Tax=Cinchona calisaya TaxID=153742 RepID=A0ABD2ZEX4_9GENT
MSTRKPPAHFLPTAVWPLPVAEEQGKRRRAGVSINPALFVPPVAKIPNSYDGALIQQQWKWTPPCHTIFKYLIPSLLAIVAVKYQAINKDPSRTRPLQTWSFLIAILLYSLVLFAAKQSRNRCNRYLESLGRAALASGVVSSLSLISLLLPYIPSLLLLYTASALFVLISTFPIIQRTLAQIKTALGMCICSAGNLFTGPPPQPQGTRPPV